MNLETTNWNGNTPLGHTWGYQLNCKDYQNAVWMKTPSIHLSEGPVVSLSCDPPVKLCLWESLSIWDVSTLCCREGKGRGEGLQMRHQPLRSPTRYNHSQLQLLYAATWPEAAGAVPAFSSPYVVLGMWSLTLWDSQKLWARGTQKWAKWQKAYQENQDVHSYSYCTARSQPQYEGNLNGSFTSEEDSNLKVTQHCIGKARNMDLNFLLQLNRPLLVSSKPQDTTCPPPQQAWHSITLWLGNAQCTAVTWSLAAPTAAPNTMEKIFLWASRVPVTAWIQFP